MLEELLSRQARIITARQARECGLTRAMIRTRLSSGRWQQICHGLLAAFSGPLSREAELWAAVLLAGSDAMLSHETAAELDGLLPRSPVVHVTIPWSQRVRDTRPGSLPPIMAHRSRQALEKLHPARLPPRTRVEETVLDLAGAARRIDDAMGLVAAACQKRLTTPDRILTALAKRPKAHWAAEIREALGDVSSRAHTLLEIGFLRRVERAHGLPHGSRQVLVVHDRRRQYDDVHYLAYRTVVELDGLVAHPLSSRRRDHRRDNLTVVRGDAPLRYGWGDVFETPCEVAAQIASVLAARGWTGKPRPCHRAECTAAAIATAA